MQQEIKYPDLQTKIIEEEISRRWNSLTYNPEGVITRESLREGVVKDMLTNGQLSKEADIIFKIVEQWGNAACPMTVMEQWLKDYAVAQHPNEQPVEQKENILSVFVPCSDDDPRCCGGYTSTDGQSLCYVREVNLSNVRGEQKENEALSLLKWLNENDWSGVGSGEYINATTGRIIKEARLYNEYQKQNNG